MNQDTKNNEWISVKERLPNKVGWYKVKAPLLKEIEYEVPFVNTENGKLIWLVPDDSIITHWKENHEGAI